MDKDDPDKRIEKLIDNYTDFEYYKRKYKAIGLVSLTCLAYLGLRVTFSAECYDFFNCSWPKQAYEYADFATGMIGVIGLPYILAWAVTYLEQRSGRKEIRELIKSNLKPSFKKHSDLMDMILK